VLAEGDMFHGVAVDPEERFAVAVGEGKVELVPLDGSPPTPLKGIDRNTGVAAVAFDSKRQRVAAGVFKGSAAQKVIGVWDLDDGSFRALGPAEDAGDGYEGGYLGLLFAADGSLLSQNRDGPVRRWDVEDGTSEVLIEGACWIFGLRPDSSSVVVGCVQAEGQADLLSIDLDSGDVTTLAPFKPVPASRPSGFALSPQGDALAVGFEDGTIAVAALDRGEPHLLLGHDSRITGLEFSPDGRSLASAGMGGRVHVWPVPDLSKPPLDALPLRELLAKLDTHTNVRMIRDETSPNGWRIDIGPFPGWAEMPEY
jgi:WD40 repeat protein